MSTAYWALSGGDLVEDWSNAGLISTNDDWSNVPSIQGWRGDGLVSATGVDPRTVTGTSEVIDVNANQTNPLTFTTGGVTEFALADPVVALQGSGTARAPYLAIYLDTTGRENIIFSTRLRDLDTDPATQPIAVQYRVGNTGAWINLPGGFVANANTGGATQGSDTLLTVTLPAAANNVPQVEIRVITTDAVGNDAWIGIDDIRVTSSPVAEVQPGRLSIADAMIAEGNAGAPELVFDVTRDGGSDGAVSATWTIAFGTANAADLGAGQALTGTVSFAAGATTATVRVTIAGDTVVEPDETITVTLSAPTGGATLTDATATGTITNDDVAVVPPPPPLPNVFINEIHYDNDGTDVGEAIEIAGAAGTDLTGWSIVLYNGNGGASYGTIALSGVIPDLQNGFGTVSVLAPGLQNGAPDGIALVAPGPRVVQFLSYEGSFTASNGPAAGLLSTDIGVQEDPAPAAGLSLQLIGTGSSAADFTWVAARDDSFGFINTDQSFLSPTGPAQLRITDASIAEGNSGTTNLVFSVNRAGGTAGTTSVDYRVVLDGTANAADLAAAAVLTGTVTFAAGETAKTITVAIAGDTIGETNETFSVVLENPSGTATIIDGVAQGLIVNDDRLTLRIFEIQGESHRSAFVGQPVETAGIVTAVDTNGFYLQDAAGDANARTSDALFVFTATAPTVRVGDAATVRGNVSEFVGGTGALSVTQLVTPTVTITSSGNPLPAAVLIGTGGSLPPTEWIDDDSFGTFDPQNDGIDFWESLEGMRVTLDAPLVVSNTNNFGETDVIVSRGVGASGVNDRGGITISPNGSTTSKGDFNPEKIQIDDDSGVFAGFTPAYSVGDGLSSVTGVLNYAFDAYEVIVIDAVTLQNDVTLQEEVTTLTGDADYLSIATYNLENLDPTDANDTAEPDKFDILAGDIVRNLKAPDILAVQEIQDADGRGNGANLSGTITAQILIDAIVAAGGPTYAYVEIAPTVAGSTGGEQGGNIRNGYFYNVDRVSYVTGSAALIEGPAYNGTRRPLVATFLFNDQAITTINVHFTSRIGSDPLFGASQPPVDAGESARTAQAAGVAAYINNELATNPALNVAVLGDFNGFYFEPEQLQLTDPARGGVLTNLAVANLPEEERYSFLFEGNTQLLDNILVTGGLALGSKYDAVHINSQLTGARGTDHDAQLALLFLPKPNTAPTELALGNATVAENLPAGTIVGTLTAKDTAGDTLTFALVDNAGGRFAVDPVTGVVTTTVALDFEAVAEYAIVARATDAGGLSVQSGFAVKVTDVNEAPVAANDAVAVNEDATSANLWTTVLGNDTDPDGDALSIRSVDTTGTLGSVVFDAATQTLRYVADADAFDTLPTGATAIDRFNYTVVDEGGLTSTATVQVTVTAIADGIVVNGGNGKSTLVGTAGEDQLYGGNGTDTLSGLDGQDLLRGGNGGDTLFGGRGRDMLFGESGGDTLDGGDGDDVLVGGQGSDTLTGGAGADLFRFGRNDGQDVIRDFDVVRDSIALDDGQSVSRLRVVDANRDGVADLDITLNWGTSVTVLGVSDIAQIRFADPAPVAAYQPSSSAADAQFMSAMVVSVLAA